MKTGREDYYTLSCAHEVRGEYEEVYDLEHLIVRRHVKPWTGSGWMATSIMSQEGPRHVMMTMRTASSVSKIGEGRGAL